MNWLGFGDVQGFAGVVYRFSLFVLRGCVFLLGGDLFGFLDVAVHGDEQVLDCGLQVVRCEVPAVRFLGQLVFDPLGFVGLLLVLLLLRLAVLLPSLLSRPSGDGDLACGLVQSWDGLSSDHLVLGQVDHGHLGGVLGGLEGEEEDAGEKDDHDEGAAETADVLSFHHHSQASHRGVLEKEGLFVRLKLVVGMMVVVVVMVVMVVVVMVVVVVVVVMVVAVVL